MSEQNAVLQDIYQRGVAHGVQESNERIAALTAELAAMTKDRDLWKDDHDGDCPYQAENARLRGELDVALLAVGKAFNLLKLAEQGVILHLRFKDDLLIEAKKRYEQITRELTEARSQVEALSKPITDEEWQQNYGHGGDGKPELADRIDFDRIIRMRLTPAAREKDNG